MAIERPNQKDLSTGDWARLIKAVNATHGVAASAPTYRQFVGVHVNAMSPAGMSWGVHSMPWMGMDGRNFLAWHRRYLARLEARLRAEDPKVVVPYWNWVEDREIPKPLRSKALLASWSVTREWSGEQIPSAEQAAAVMGRSGFSAFQSALEAIHGAVHVAVGGTMNSASSPADPIFWLHHANVDRYWAEWQAGPLGQDPPNPDEVLRPAPLIGVKVASVLKPSSLGYKYV